MDGQLILARIQSYLQSANTSAPGMSEEIIEEAGERLKEVLRKTFNTQRGTNFRVYMSNAGRASCALTMERNGAKAEPQSYSFRLKMLVGDISEIVLRAVIKGSGTPIEKSNVKVELPIAEGISVRGEYDFRIGGRIWDAKSASNYSFRNKWQSGFSHIEANDDFGYCAQLYGYAIADNAVAGGFFVLNKETGEVSCTSAIDTPEYRDKHLKRIKDNVFKVLDTERPFERNYKDEEETFYGKPTGNRKLGFSCSYCVYKWDCWPGLVRKDKVQSEAKNKQLVYYTVYDPASEITKVEEKVQLPKDGKKVATRKRRASTAVSEEVAQG